MHGDDKAADDAPRLEAAFVEGFRAAGDKLAFLKLAGVPFDLGAHGLPQFKLVEVGIDEDWTVGVVSPSFGSPELSHQPLPTSMMDRRVGLSFRYVSSAEHRSLLLADLLQPLSETVNSD